MGARAMAQHSRTLGALAEPGFSPQHPLGGSRPSFNSNSREPDAPNTHTRYTYFHASKIVCSHLPSEDIVRARKQFGD